MLQTEYIEPVDTGSREQYFFKAPGDSKCAPTTKGLK